MPHRKISRGQYVVFFVFTLFVFCIPAFMSKTMMNQLCVLGTSPTMQPNFANIPEHRRAAYEQVWGQGPQEELCISAGVQCHQRIPRQVSLVVQQTLAMSSCVRGIALLLDSVIHILSLTLSAHERLLSQEYDFLGYIQPAAATHALCRLCDTTCGSPRLLYKRQTVLTGILAASKRYRVHS